MRPFRLLVLLLVSGFSLPAAAQAPRTVAGVCGRTNWVCVSECIDAECVDQCMREGCEDALKRLKACTSKAACAPDDSACAAKSCGLTCEKSFEPAPKSPEKLVTNPCEGDKAPRGTAVPKELVGTWVLSAASIPDTEDGKEERIDVQPRSDYARSLQVTPDGCFVMRTKLDDATLGRGSTLDVRAWGRLEASEAKDKKHLALRTQDGQAVGPVCGKPRVVPLSKGRFKGGEFTYVIEEKDSLILTVPGPTRQTFQFEREKQEAPEPPPKP
ncbi:hypothetical protein D7X55_35760 [Corallococcus sp. AB049A]|uniref:hypothetical protein n=1 Tax=Corallococcus sp. AB049A TaxID=2316721 RepID=UPI000EA2BA85|nr:hypothetical protein [Corallococcus sp. AB049A]RKH39624.1 hypothetical protein D7Y23_36140 [Corallococcus sp. AB050B]RKI49474.1 hypothetical protein D7X55_35760 [Corallococcus sp. AB049A]